MKGEVFKIIVFQHVNVKCKFNVKHRECLCDHPDQIGISKLVQAFNKPKTTNMNL